MANIRVVISNNLNSSEMEFTALCGNECLSTWKKVAAKYSYAVCSLEIAMPTSGEEWYTRNLKKNSNIRIWFGHSMRLRGKKVNLINPKGIRILFLVLNRIF